MKSNFKNFITSLLKRGNIGNKHMEKYTSEENLKLFQIAFTHKSYDPDVNYELPELIGDGIVNFSVTNYLREWDPNIVSVKYLTRLKHNITSKKELATIAEKAGFWDHILISDELSEKFKPMTLDYKHKNKEYMSLLEDSFEAFIGTVKLVIEKYSDVETIGVTICYQIIKSFLKEIKISLKYEDIFDAKTRFKELCDKRGWDFSTAMKTRDAHEQVTTDIVRRMFEVTVYGYPLGSKAKEDNNRIILACLKRPIKMDAQNDAAEASLTLLKNRYNIFDIPQDPYTRKN